MEQTSLSHLLAPLVCSFKERWEGDGGREGGKLREREREGGRRREGGIYRYFKTMLKPLIKQDNTLKNLKDCLHNTIKTCFTGTVQSHDYHVTLMCLPSVHAFL